MDTEDLFIIKFHNSKHIVIIIVQINNILQNLFIVQVDINIHHKFINLH